MLSRRSIYEEARWRRQPSRVAGRSAIACQALVALPRLVLADSADGMPNSATGWARPFILLILSHLRLAVA